MTIAFFGLGNMGAPMAINLLKGGKQLKVYDLIDSHFQQLQKQGASVASSPQECVEGAEVVISMLPAGKHVSDLYLGHGSDGILACMAPSTLIIDCSTIDADTVKNVAKQANECGVSFLDAPVSGGIAGAQSGTLNFMCGGNKEAYNQALPILGIMGKNMFHAGESGAGQVAKMCNNMLLSMIMIGSAEALKLGMANGMDAKVLTDIIMASTGKNWALEVANPQPGVLDSAPSSHGYQNGFMVDLMCKDLGLAADNSAENGLKLPLSQLAKDLFDQHQANGAGRFDFSSIIHLYS